MVTLTREHLRDILLFHLKELSEHLQYEYSISTIQISNAFVDYLLDPDTGIVNYSQYLGKFFSIYGARILLTDGPGSRIDALLNRLCRKNIGYRNLYLLRHPNEGEDGLLINCKLPKSGNIWVDEVPQKETCKASIASNTCQMDHESSKTAILMQEQFGDPPILDIKKWHLFQSMVVGKTSSWNDFGCKIEWEGRIEEIN